MKKNVRIKSFDSLQKNGFVFAITLFNVSIIIGLIVVFLMNSVSTQSVIGGKSLVHKIAYWKAMSRISMLEQLIKDYGFEAVSQGNVINHVSFYFVDECHRRVVSEVNLGGYRQIVEGMLENENCDSASAFPGYSMIYKVADATRQGRGHDHGWRHLFPGRNPNSWGWRTGTGECEDVWGWNWQFPCEEDTLVDTLVYYNEYGEFLITGENGTLDGELYVGADVIINYMLTNSIPHVGENEGYSTHLMVPVSSSVVPSTPIDHNNYTWETVAAMDLPDFDHHAYDSLLAVAQGISHDPQHGKFVGDVNWPYDGEWSATDWFHLQNYEDRMLYINGNCQIKYCTIENIGGSSTDPGIIVATGDIVIDNPENEFIPDNIILISGGDIEITGANFGSSMDDQYWGSVVNEIYSRGKVTLTGENGKNRILAQVYAFGTDNMSESVRIQFTDFFGLLYAPNLTSKINLASYRLFKGALYANQIKNDRFDNNFIQLNYRFPTHYLSGGMTGIYQDTENWVLVKGSIRNI